MHPKNIEISLRFLCFERRNFRNGGHIFEKQWRTRSRVGEYRGKGIPEEGNTASQKPEGKKPKEHLKKPQASP